MTDLQSKFCLWLMIKKPDNFTLNQVADLLYAKDRVNRNALANSVVKSVIKNLDDEKMKITRISKIGRGHLCVYKVERTGDI